MKLNIVSKRLASASPWQCAETCLAFESIPIVQGMIWLRSQKYWWQDEESARNGRQMLYEMGVSMLTNCNDEVVQAVDRLYRLQDSIHNGTVYSRSGEGTPQDPYVYNPPMPSVPLTAVYSEPGLRWNVDDLREMLANFTQGTATVNYPDVRNPRQQLQEILTAIQGMEGADTEQIENLLNLIVLALG
jgi:hypothetical protein